MELLSKVDKVDKILEVMKKNQDSVLIRIFMASMIYISKPWDTQHRASEESALED